MNSLDDIIFPCLIQCILCTHNNLSSCWLCVVYSMLCVLHSQPSGTFSFSIQFEKYFEVKRSARVLAAVDSVGSQLSLSRHLVTAFRRAILCCCAVLNVVRLRSTRFFPFFLFSLFLSAVQDGVKVTSCRLFFPDFFYMCME